jgi:putative transposase
MLHFNERDFLLASGNRGRQLWAEHFLEFPLSSDESWRLASYEFFRERFEKRLLEEMGDRALDLRPERDEDPGSAEYKARLLAALAEDHTTFVGAAVEYENTLFRIPAITRADANGHAKNLRAWSLNRAPVLPDAVVESVNILREAHVAALMGLVANGMTVTGSGFAVPYSGLVDPVASKWVDWVRLTAGYDLAGCRRTLQKGINGLHAIASNPCCPKYRRPVLVKAVALEVMPDHVHLFIETDPRWSISQLTRQFKGFTSHVLRNECPSLRSRLPTLWSRSYFAGSCGAVTEATVRRYIEEQKRS